ncbi:Oxygen sensor histidine kinase NreB [Gemmata obscuriglobus]|nr:PAS domain S-box protein [Gemmata obscuriglobus]QEG27869.1 Oxygen sensor histidine kinase NreB [Gemmata obscuriglobus]VTS05264.1 methylase of chemotaxis methyl-accepting protein : Uncharacterized protein OS=Ensifer adhaerens GN=FA04_18380 PE=4 SV=1: CheB_methylest: CheR_N: CheR: PAS_10: PAS_4: PAS_3: PAS_4: PAS_4: PAS_4: PAS_3: PAS_3: PAS_9: HisKA_3: HATPase_c [Gemmata obscuriglobus UQM 2246]
MADEIAPAPPAPEGPPDAEQDRLAQPVDAEQPPRLPFPVVGVGASAGGLEAFSAFLAAMPPDAGMAFVFILHLPPDHNSLLADILARRTAMPVHQVEDGLAVEPDHVYVTRPGHVVGIREGRLRVGPELGGPRAANRPVDDFFRTLAEEQRERAVCVLLSGMGSNGTAGAQAVKAVGGLCVAQDPDSAQYPSMPRHLIDAGYADYIVRPADLPDVLLTYARSRYATGGREADARAALEREQQHLREVVAILRTRTRQDFTGYKKPTILRRVQRRMGLLRVPTMAEYARHLRQSPNEVTGLADDLLIHVTGFFRDPEAWEVLREKVIAPLVRTREAGGPVRAWVAACSSGEEAYTLAMILVEESDRADKRLDIKVFATDLADRTLSHARAGVYPGGIESEISSERLRRFFTREDEVYRVRQELRDRVVFAPQNILQDPPFSRLDIATCRNLLIYLEAEVQKRVLTLLHFGLREGGALFLGTSETIGGAEELFEPVDKKARIYRRVGPTRHGLVEFPLPRPVPPLAAPDEARGQAPAPRPSPPGDRSVGELTRQALLEHHAPPAVAVDRDFRVVYYHGDTSPFLRQASGEPTRDLLLLAREGVRGAVRLALQQAAAQQQPATARDGWVERPGRRVRVEVTASPVPAGTRAGHFVVSFEEYGEVPAAAGPDGETGDLARLRAELQSTIEELQTSNEELKASHEEAMSVNEELQSANEELETSKEEMQSLNEELRTVNAQLRAKMEEHQAASSDLTSLLTSTDIAVLFLDTRFRIRRFTPAVRDLLDLIPGDIGRPLTALARKFDDPHLDDDCRAVLERLAPVAREVPTAAGRHYLRRVLPYRTVDDRIDGVVVTFVDVTERKRAEDALAAEKGYAESIVETLHEPLLILHPDLTVKGVNPAFYTHFRVNPAGTIGRKVYHLGNGQWDIPALRTLLEDVLPGSNVFNDYEVTHEFEGLGRRVMLVNGRRLDHAQLILLGVRDITDRKRAEEALRESNVRFRSIANLVPDLLWSSRSDGYTEWYNQRWSEYTGQTLEQAADWGWTDAIHPDDREGSARRYGAAVSAGKALVQEHRIRRHDGAYRWFLVRAEPVRDETGRLTMFGSATDTHDQRTMMAAVLASEEKYRTLFEAIDAGFAIFEMIYDAAGAPADLRYVETNPAFERQAGRRPGPGQTMRELFPAAGDMWLADYAEVARTGRSKRFVDQAPGLGRWFDVFVFPVAAGRLAALVRDVTTEKQAEDALRASEARYRALVESQVEMVAQFRPDGTLLFVNGAYARAFGTTPERLTGTNFWDLIPPEGHAAVRARLDALTPETPLVQIENMIAAAGGPRWTLWTNRALTFDAAGRVAEAQSAGVDITDRKRAEAALQRSERRLAAVAAHLPSAAVFVVGRDLRYQLADGEAMRDAGAAPADFVGKTVREAIGPALADGYEGHYRAALGGAPFRHEHTIHGRHYVTHGVPLRDAAGEIDAALAVSYDITARKQTETALHEGEERLRLAVAIGELGTWDWDTRTRRVVWNDTHFAMQGYAVGEVAPSYEAWVARVHPDDRAGAVAALESARDVRAVYRHEFRSAHPDGSVRWLSARGRFFYDEAGAAVRMIGVMRDVTEQRVAEDALRRSEERLRLALSAARMGTWTWDVAADAHRRDASLNALLGLPAAETTAPFEEFLAHIHPDDREAVRAAFDQSVRHGRLLSTEFRAVWPDGTVRWLRDQGDVFGTAGQARMTGACVDVTERREAEDAVRASEERLRLILESATDFAIITLDAGRAVTTWSPGAEATFGFTAGEMMGRPGDLLFTPEDRASGAPEQEATEARETGRAAEERWHVRKDGSRFWASGVLAPLGTDGANGFVKVLRDLTERKRAEDELRRARDELELRVAERTTELAAALDALETEMQRRRDLVRRLGTAQEDERQRVARDLHDTVGQLMAGLALAFKAVEQSGALPAAAVTRLADAQRVMNELGREVHGLAVRLRPTALDDFGLEAALAQLVTEWSGRTGVPAEFHASGLARLPREIETAVYRVVQEALTNVAKHANATTAGVAVARPDGFVSVVIEDDGAGFDPLAPPKGRLGLLGMRERVELLGGSIDIESSPGAGTTVTVQIPVAQNGGES